MSSLKPSHELSSWTNSAENIQPQRSEYIFQRETLQINQFNNINQFKKQKSLLNAGHTRRLFYFSVRHVGGCVSYWVFLMSEYMSIEQNDSRALQKCPLKHEEYTPKRPPKCSPDTFGKVTLAQPHNGGLKKWIWEGPSPEGNAQMASKTGPKPPKNNKKSIIQ